MLAEEVRARVVLLNFKHPLILFLLLQRGRSNIAGMLRQAEARFMKQKGALFLLRR